MIITQSDITAKIRTAIDDIVPEAADTFTDDTDAELWQATQHAVEKLLQDLPLEYLAPRSILEDTNLQEVNGQAKVDTDTGIGYIILPDKFLRFVSLRMEGWISPLYTLIEPGSDDELRQRSPWGRGTPDKPKAMVTYRTAQESGQQDYSAQRILKFWTAAPDATSGYKKNISEMNYIPSPKVEYPEEPEPETEPAVTEETTEETPAETRSAATTTVEEPQITCALRPEAEKMVIYQAASVFFEGKKEPETAEKFRNI